MKVRTLNGDRRDAHLIAIVEELTKRPHDRYQTLWLYHDNGTELAVMLNADIANIHYFPTIGHPGFVSIGTGSPDAPAVDFLADNGEPTQVPAEHVVSSADAEAVIRDYWSSGERSAIITWSEL